MADTLILPSGKQQRVDLKITDKFGNPAKVDGIPTWTTTDGATITVEPDADGMSGLIHTTGPIGEADADVLGDADLGAGVKPIHGILHVQVIAGDATTIVLTPTGDPTDQA